MNQVHMFFKKTQLDAALDFDYVSENREAAIYSIKIMSRLLETFGKHSPRNK
jgi:hypothetical protein